MRKILTNWVCILEDENYTTLGWFEKSQGFVEKRSKIIFTRRCEIFTNPWLFLIISPLFFMKSPHFFGGKPWKILGFCWKVWKNLFFNPARIAYFRPTDLVVENKRKIPPEKCEKFWQNQPKISYEKENSLQSRKFPSFYLDISKKVHTFASLF